MNEDVLKELLGEMLKREFEKFDDPPKWNFSLKHRLAMKRIFARYNRNAQKLKEKPTEQAAPIERQHIRLNLKQRLIIALIVVFLMALTGCVVATFISKHFHGTVYEDNTLLTPANVENAPLTIEYAYTLNSVPEGFELIETGASKTDVYTLYQNNLTNQTIAVCQWVKSRYTPHINTEHRTLEEIRINNTTGLYVDMGYENYYKTLLVWDNGDYILQVSADLDKETTIKLSEINKFEKLSISYAP